MSYEKLMEAFKKTDEIFCTGSDRDGDKDKDKDKDEDEDIKGIKMHGKRGEKLRMPNVSWK